VTAWDDEINDLRIPASLYLENIPGLLSILTDLPLAREQKTKI
jgi:hypothetical protein